MGNCFRNPTISFSNATKLGTESVYSPPQEEVDVDPELEPMEEIVSPNLKKYTLAQLKCATGDFNNECFLGKGGYGGVYKGWVDETTLAPSSDIGVGIPVAVKKYENSDESLKEWKTEMKFLGQSSHSNVVKLLGYCREDKAFLLVNEYMHKGSLDTHLFTGGEQLSWETRLKIVIGAARGLAFLHTDKQVIHRNFKPANILLDGELNAKVSELGLAKSGPTNGHSHISTTVMGTYGYAAPEYIATGHLYVNSDVYSFGVVLLEILTGRRVIDMSRPSSEKNLVEWARPHLYKKGTSRRIMDPNLKGLYPIKGAYKAATLVQKCLVPNPKDRPSMDDVVYTLEQINAIKLTL